MSTLQLLFDLFLVLALLLTALASLASRDLFRAVVFFIAFGLLMSLAWVRLHAPDLAIAEAAIGAGLSGALLLHTAALLGQHPVPKSCGRLTAALACLLIFTLLGTALALLPPVPAPVLAEALAEAMPDSGVQHPLTAVLLNFRAFDTFLEVAVLTLAAVISLALQAGTPEPPLQPVDNPLLRALVVWCGPVMLLLAVYLYWAGSKEPGGAFQAGALLAGAGLLLRLSGTELPLPGRAAGLRLAMIAGLALFLLAALLGPLLGLPLFSFPPPVAGPLILGIEGLLALSIAFTLLSLYNAAAPPQGGKR